jgi:RNA polymerase sigma factor (sigma-70 family)
MEAAGSQVPFSAAHAYPSSPRLLRLASDERLVGRVRAGSEQAFAVLYERHYRKVLSFCRHMLGSAEDAEDAVQQSFVSAYRDMLRDDKEINFRPWLYRIARNHCISALRARRPVADLDEAEPSTVGLSQQVADRDELRDLLHDLARLPDDQREALVLAELHDNSHSDVAEILGCDREKVKSLVFQARNSLIKSREARDTPCEEIRRQLSVLHGGSLRRSVIRRHLAECDGCRAWRNAAKSQRRAMAILLPVVPSSALKFGAGNAIAAAGAAGVVSHGAASGGVFSGTLTTLASKLGLPAVVVKGAATAATVAVVAAGGTVAVKEIDDQLGSKQNTPAVETAPPGPSSSDELAPGLSGPATTGPGAVPGRQLERKHGRGHRGIGRSRSAAARAKHHGRGPLNGLLNRRGAKRPADKQNAKPLSRGGSEKDPSVLPGEDKTPPASGGPRESSPRAGKSPSGQTITPEEDPLLDTSDPTATP